jgi:hypothetical protein
VILTHCFFNQNTVSAWFRSAVLRGNVALLESFYSILYPLPYDTNDSARVAEWVKGTVMIDLEYIAIMLGEQSLFDLDQRTKLATYFTVLHGLYDLSQSTTNSGNNRTGLFDYSVDYSGGKSINSNYRTLAHFIFEELPEVAKFEYLYVSHQQFFEILYDGPVKLADINVQVNIESFELPLLHMVVKAGKLSPVECIIDKLGGDIDVVGAMDDGNDAMYISALNIACFYGHENIVEYLLTKGASVNHSSTPSSLVFAVQKRIHYEDRPSEYSPKIAKLLIEYGADIEEYENDTYYNDEYIFPEALSLFTITNKKRRMN